MRVMGDDDDDDPMGKIHHSSRRVDDGCDEEYRCTRLKNALMMSVD